VKKKGSSRKKKSNIRNKKHMRGICTGQQPTILFPFSAFSKQTCISRSLTILDTNKEV
jgi:hypothetical protein